MVLKSDGRISHKQDAFSPTTFEPQQLCGILTGAGSGELVQPPFKLRNSK